LHVLQLSPLLSSTHVFSLWEIVFTTITLLLQL
jgi:hypothetical protein